MAAALPVVGIESPGVGDIVEHGKTGLLAEQELASFASMMSRMVGSQDDRADFADRAARQADQYDIGKTTGMLEELYLRLTSKPADQKQSSFAGFWHQLMKRF